MAHDFIPTGEEHYLSLDPGNSTGFATFKANGDLIRSGTIRGRLDLYDFLDHFPTKIGCVIVEDYKLFPWKAMAQSWDKLDTVRYIGAVDFWAGRVGIPVVYQDPKIKGIAYRWAGITVPKNHDFSHETDAFVHGVYFLQNKGIRRPQQGRSSNDL